MRNAYRILAIIIAVEVVIQAMAMVFAVAGLGIWVDEGGVLDKAAFESDDLSFTGVGGFIVHGINGMMIIPLLGLALLVISFFAKVPGGVKIGGDRARRHRGAGLPRASSATSRAYIGALHGLNAFILFGSAVYAARLARTADVGTPTTRRCVTPDRTQPLLAYVKAHLRQIVAIAATLAIVVPLAWMWQASRMPGSYSVMDMGYVDAGGGPVSAAAWRPAR